MAQYWTRNKMH